MVSGADPVPEIVEKAVLAEEYGYSSVWITVLAGQTDPVTVLASTLAATRRIEVGLGLVPLSAFGGEELGRGLAAREVDAERVIVGLGVGSHHRGGPAFWQREATAFKRAAPDLRTAVGSYGERVLRVGGGIADAVLVNWMTPERIEWALARVDEGARAARRPPPRPLFAYVAAACEPGGAARIEAALASMAQYPYHRRHQEAMAATGLVGVVARSPGDVEAGLSRYADAVPVVYPVGDLDARGRLDVLRRFAPVGAD